MASSSGDRTLSVLVEGSYRQAERQTSSRLIMALSEATLVVVDTFSTKDLASL
jgi:hypothetical protein